MRYHYANNLEEEIEKLRYDLYYIKHMSPWLDLLILFETVKVVCGYNQTPRTVEAAPAPAHKPAKASRRATKSRRVRFAGNVRHTGET